MDAATGGSVGVWSPNQLAYWYAFNNGDFGKAAAISVGLLLISLIGALLIIFKTDFYRLDTESR
jgi:multiple sugar transport system permease protein